MTKNLTSGNQWIFVQILQFLWFLSCRILFRCTIHVYQSAEYVKYAKIFGDYFWLIFISTEDLGDHSFLILCLLKILATHFKDFMPTDILVTHSWRFYAYWRSWLVNGDPFFQWKEMHDPIFKKYCSCYVLKKIMQGFASLGTYETGLIWNGMILWNAVRKLITSFWKKKKIVD